MNTVYFSFLICDRTNIINLYFSGIPLGVIECGAFRPHEFTNADGSKRQISINDLPHPCPFENLDQIIDSVILTLKQVKFDNTLVTINGAFEEINENTGGEYLSLKEFKESVERGLFTEDDGIGYFCNQKRMFKLNFEFVDLKNPPAWATHVIWFNK